jgi:hypothetical protein
MHAQTPDREDDMNKLERRLASWQPASVGLDADAVLFAAGRAAGRRGRLYWAASCAVLTMLAVGLGLWGISERAERQVLASRLAPVLDTASSSDGTTLPEPSYSPSPNGYLNVRRQAEEDPGRWLASSQFEEPSPPGPPPPESAILRSGQLEGILNQ